jgi:hypothetical protein
LEFESYVYTIGLKIHGISQRWKKKQTNLERNRTFSRAMDAVNPDVSIATTSGSGLGTGIRLLAEIFHQKDI